jgi:hypothetical protein
MALGCQIAQVGLERRHSKLIGTEPPVVAGALAQPAQELTQFAPLGLDCRAGPASQRLNVFFQKSAFSHHLAFFTFLVRVSPRHSGVFTRAAGYCEPFLTSEGMFCDDGSVASFENTTGHSEKGQK